jgi:hypothetical protein
METYTIEFTPFFLALNFFADSVVQKFFPEKKGVVFIKHTKTIRISLIPVLLGIKRGRAI